MIKFKEFCEKFYKREEKIEDIFLTEMSMVLDNIKPNLAIWVENPIGYNNKYFKIYNSYSNTKASKIARISMKNPEYLFHGNNEGKEVWTLNNREKKDLIKILKSISDYGNNITNWELTILTYNRDNFHIGIGKYATGQITKSEYEEMVKEVNSKIKKDDRYKALSLNLPMPDYMKL